MLFTKKGFTLVELMVAVVLSAIVIFFSYTMTISAYKMFSKVSNTANNFNNPQFFEEYFKRVFETAYDIDFSPTEFRCDRFDPYVKKDGDNVSDRYKFEKKGGGDTIPFTQVTGDSHLDSVVNLDTLSEEPGSAKLIVRIPGAGSKIENVVLLSNVKAFYYRYDPVGDDQFTPLAPRTHLRSITIGVVYDDYIVPGVPKRQFKTFCFALRNQRLTLD